MIHFKGQKDSISGWARRYGLKPTLLHSRLERGWPFDLALTTPVDKVYSNDKCLTKGELELELNDLKKDELPKQLKKLLNNYHGTKYGMFIRANFRKEFDRWAEGERNRRGRDEKDKNLSEVPKGPDASKLSCLPCPVPCRSGAIVA